MNDNQYSDYVEMPDARIILCDTLRQALNLTMAQLGRIQPYYLTDKHTEQMHEAVRFIGDARAVLKRVNKRTRDNRGRKKSA